MKISRKLLLSAALTFAFGVVSADVVDDAKALFDAGNSVEAKDMLLVELQSNPKSNRAGAINNLLGIINLDDGDLEEAKFRFNEAAKKGVADAYLYLGDMAMRDFDFGNASSNYAKYRDLKKRAKKLAEAELVNSRETRLAKLENALNYVEKIAVIDTLQVPKSEFFKHYRLPDGSGYLVDVQEANDFLKGSGIEIRDAEAPVYVSPSKDLVIWSTLNPDDSIYHLHEAIRQSDGKFKVVDTDDFSTLSGAEIPSETESVDEESAPTVPGVSLLYPFMMPDGVTFYFAKDDPDTGFGGLDIYRSTLDSTSGEFLEPSNIGFPFNSPEDDYMLCIDEENGVGWWASERSGHPDEVTIYVYVTNPERITLNPEEVDEEEIKDMAMLRNLEDLTNAEYDALRDTISNIRSNFQEQENDFYFQTSKNQVYTTFKSLPSADARYAMKAYLTAQKRYDDFNAKLSGLRKEYNQNPARRESLKNEILSMEREADSVRKALLTARNDLYKTLK